jgi:hypothetical protein
VRRGSGLTGLPDLPRDGVRELSRSVSELWPERRTSSFSALVVFPVVPSGSPGGCTARSFARRFCSVKARLPGSGGKDAALRNIAELGLGLGCRRPECFIFSEDFGALAEAVLRTLEAVGNGLTWRPMVGERLLLVIGDALPLRTGEEDLVRLTSDLVTLGEISLLGEGARLRGTLATGDGLPCFIFRLRRALAPTVDGGEGGTGGSWVDCFKGELLTFRVGRTRPAGRGFAPLEEDSTAVDESPASSELWRTGDGRIAGALNFCGGDGSPLRLFTTSANAFVKDLLGPEAEVGRATAESLVGEGRRSGAGVFF